MFLPQNVPTKSRHKLPQHLVEEECLSTCPSKSAKLWAHLQKSFNRWRSRLSICCATSRRRCSDPWFAATATLRQLRMQCKRRFWLLLSNGEKVRFRRIPVGGSPK